MALAPTLFGMMYLFLSGLSCVNVVGLVGSIQTSTLTFNWYKYNYLSQC